jgi:YidC/Oxa1 family membrane protein insertase
MQEQGKRLLLAAVIAMGVLMAWNQIFPPKKPDVKPTAGSGSVAAGNAGTVASSNRLPVVSESTVPAAPRGAEQLTTLTFKNFTATFSSYGGAIKSWKLGDQRYERDVSKGELIPQMSETSAGQINFVNSVLALPLEQEWTAEKVRDDLIRYSLNTDKVQITKVFTLFPEQFAVNLEVSVTVKGGAASTPQILTMSLFGYQNPKDSGGGGTSVKARVWASASYRDKAILVTPLKSLKESGRTESGFEWTGFEHPFMLVGLSPKPSATGVIEKHSYVVPSTDGLMRTDVWFPLSAESSVPAVVSAFMYLGPNYYDKLTATDAVAGRPTHFNNVLDFGWFGFVGRPLLWLLKAIYGLCGNWGVAIVLLTFVVKAATGYWTMKQLRGANLMRAIQPKVKEVQERYKGDVQRQRQEQMALNQQYGVNPFAGCLPGLLQMPVWIGLYRMLSSAGETYLQPFIPGWINDLTATDPMHILPVLAAGLQVVQMKLSPAAGTDPMQQKMMMYLMPVVFGAMSWFFPAGLSLYMFTNAALSVMMAVYVNKYDKTNAAAVAKIAAQIATDSAPAKNSIEDLKKQSVAGATASDEKPQSLKGSGGNKGKKRRV